MHVLCPYIFIFRIAAVSIDLQSRKNCLYLTGKNINNIKQIYIETFIYTIPKHAYLSN